MHENIPCGRGIMEINEKDVMEMNKYMGGINEPRRTVYGNIRHKLIDIIVIAFTAVLCGYDEFEEMEEFGRLKQDFFKEFLELPHGIPDESTFRKVINRLDPLQLHKSLDNWLRVLGNVKKPMTILSGQSILTGKRYAEARKRAGKGFMWLARGSGKTI
jgi:hypothetical protein